MTSKIVPIPEVGPQIGRIGRSKVYKLIRERELVRVRIGSRAFVTQASIDAYLDRLVAEAS